MTHLATTLVHIPYVQQGLCQYYAALATELEHEPWRMHGVAARQRELDALTQDCVDFAAGSRVLEIACGVGFWTKRIASSAVDVCATDISEATIRVARRRVDMPNVRFAIQDARNLGATAFACDRVFGGFFLSHLRRQSLPGFFAGLHRQLRPATAVLFFDNAIADRTLRTVHSIDAAGNTFEWRSLRSGWYRVLKNCLSDEELKVALQGHAIHVKIARGEFYWALSYSTRR